MPNGPDKNDQKQYQAALIIIGNEILSGRTQDTNTQWIGEKLNQRGIRLVEVRVVPDKEDAIIKAINEVRPSVDYLLTTGGIGPTHDDITSESVAKAFKVKLIQHPEAYKILENYYGKSQLTEARLKMAMVPEGATLIDNPVSAAPGFKIDNVHVMAGVPRIMQAMLESIMQGMQKGDPILSNTVTCTLGESVIADDLGNLQARYNEVEIGSYPHYRGGILGLSLVLRSSKDSLLDKATQELIEIIRAHGGEPRALSIRSSGSALKA